MLFIKSLEEIEIQRKSALLVGATLAQVALAIKEGVTLLEIDKLAETFIRDNGGIPSFKGYSGFPATLCMSPNEQVVHGIPSEYTLKPGDILSVDCGVFMNGFHGDSAYTFAIGEVDGAVMNLLKRTKISLYKGIEQIRPNARIGDISYAIESATKRQYNYGIVKELVGHGVGRDLHEEPQVPNYGKRGRGIKLKPGIVLAIEPMINLGVQNIVFHEDGWTVTTKDKKPSAHYEHTVAVTEKGYDILSSFEDIEKAELTNSNLQPVI